MYNIRCSVITWSCLCVKVDFLSQSKQMQLGGLETFICTHSNTVIVWDCLITCPVSLWIHTPIGSSSPGCWIPISNKWIFYVYLNSTPIFMPKKVKYKSQIQQKPSQPKEKLRLKHFTDASQLSSGAKCHLVFLWLTQTCIQSREETTEVDCFQV